jgi:hypothetical protein
MARHETERGIIDGTSDGRRALLADFDIEGAALRPAHEEWLAALVGLLRRSALRPPDGIWEVTVVGRASKTGSDAYNLALSRRRVQAVQLFVQARLGGQPIVWNDTALGEGFPLKAGISENARDRSVEVTARPRVTLPPPEIVRPVRTIRPRHFDLVVTSYLITIGSGVSLRLGEWLLNLTITDQASDASMPYFFEGSGSAAPVAPTPFTAEIVCATPSAMQPFTVEDRRMPDGSRLDETSFAGDAAIKVALGSPTVFRFGGNRLTGRGAALFPMVRIADLALPKASFPLPLFCVASGRLKRGVRPPP